MATPGRFCWCHGFASLVAMETGLVKMDNHFREDMKELRGVLVQALARDSITAP